MADRTVRQLPRRRDLVFADQLAPESRAIGRRLPVHVEYIFARSNKQSRLTVTVQAPFHRQAVLAPGERHLVNLSVTGHAPHTLVEMNAVIKVNKVRQIVNADPFDGFVFAEARADGLEHRCVRPDLRVTVHAGLGWGQTCKRAVFYGCMTIPAINAEATDMMLVLKPNVIGPKATQLGKVLAEIEIND